MPVSTLVAVTLAPVTTAPLASVTVPDMLAVTLASKLPQVIRASAKIKRPKYLPSFVICMPTPPPIFTHSYEPDRRESTGFQSRRYHRLAHPAGNVRIV